MKTCEENRSRIFLYLDDELRGQELADFGEHLRACAACREAVEDERRFLNGVRSAGPLYTPSTGLRRRVECIVRHAPAEATALGLGHRIREFMQRVMTVRPGFGLLTPQAAAAFLLLLGIFGGVWIERNLGRSHAQPEFAALALKTHKRHAKGKLPLEVRSESPEVVAAWFKDKVPYHVVLPASEQLPGEAAAYQIEGGGLLPYRNGQAAYVSYEVRGKPVSLLVVPTSMVSLSAPKKVAMGKLTIYYDTVDGFHVVTWSVPRGVTYALVSDRGEHPNQSCIVCHAGAKDRQFMSNLVSQ